MKVSAEENTPIIIAHRGASAIFPEHTLEGYRKAIELGADFIEPDLVISKDGVLVARHDIYLSTTTNVADHPEFADRARFTSQLNRSDWMVYDFTLAELKTLRAVQPMEGRDKSHDGKYEIPTFAEIIELAKSHNSRTGSNVGVYPETKQPEIHNDLGFNFASILLTELRAGGVADGEIPIYIQSFGIDILHELAPLTKLPLIYLLEKQDEDEVIARVKVHAAILTGIGPDKRMLMAKGGKASKLLLVAKEMGLKTHPWTFRDDDVGEGFKTADAEYMAYLRLGIDGFFTDFTDTGVRLRQVYLNEHLDENRGNK